MFELINGIATGVATAAIAWVTYKEFDNTPAIASAINIALGAVSGICMLFVKGAPQPEQK